MKFDGFLKIYTINEDSPIGQQILPPLEKEEKLTLHQLEKSQKFTQPPARYSEATLIRELEKKGIGRPSTYAPTLSTILERGYVEKAQGKLLPREIGEIVTDLLVQHFPGIIDYNFTAKMEEELDEIAFGRRQWQKVIANFYEPFINDVNKKTLEVSKQSITEKKTNKKCPQCGQNLKIKLGRFGKFLACSGFPKCKYTAPLLDKLELPTPALVKEKCPQCGKKLHLKEGKFGPFLACTGFPKCKYTKNIVIEAKIKCPNCGGKIIRKNTRKGKIFWGCVNFPQCKTAYWDEPQKETCPKCKNLLTLNSKTKLLKCSQCEYKENS
jgi:DNA topoisomerase-1